MAKTDPDRAGGPTELANFGIDPESVRLLRATYCLQHHVVVLGTVDRTAKMPVDVGMLDPSDLALVDAVSRVLGRDVHAVRLSAWEIQRALSEGFGLEGEETEEFRLTLSQPEDISFAPQVPVTQILNEILGRAVALGASDIHIETYEEDIDVRLRIDGTLHHLDTPLSRGTIAGAISRLKIVGGLDIVLKRVAQDGRIRAVFESDGAKRKIDFRLSVAPGPFGEDAVMRILDSGKPLVGLEALGLVASDLAIYERLVSNPEGLVLVTGPTGSGKTTTLYAALDRINTINNKILTVEDPIEYSFAKVNQKQITPTMGFAEFARAFMRQNPDIILIGEIRDEDTADAAIRAAQTGHLVLSTLHTSDAVRTVSRLVTLGIDRNLVAGVLLGSLSQRLVRKLCPTCRKPMPPTERERGRFRLAPSDTAFFGPAGCDACGGTGFRGRIGLFEMFVIDAEIADLISADRPIQEIRRRALGNGMRSLVGDGLAKARDGATTLTEVLRVVPFRIIEEES